MVGTMVCLAVAAMGIDVGWEPSDNGLEYIIQIEPEMLESLRAGQVIRSDIRPDLRQVRSYRIQVGTAPLPKKGLPEPPPVESKKPPIAPPKDAAAGKIATPDVPSTLPKGDDPKHIAAPANYQESSGPAGGLATREESSSAEVSDKYRSAMMAFAAAAVGLLAALVYLGWIHVGTRNRYRALLAEHMASGQPVGCDPIDRSWLP